MSFEEPTDTSGELVELGLQVAPEVIVLEGVTGILVPGENGEPGTRFWVSQKRQTDTDSVSTG